MQKKAIIAMSGGVDSSVAAYLMVKDGYDCAGATLSFMIIHSAVSRDTAPAAPHLIPKMPEALPHDLECSITSSQCMMNSATVSLTNLQILICTVAHRTRVLTVTVFEILCPSRQSKRTWL